MEDTQLPYVVELVDGQGRVVRTWQTRFETQDDPGKLTLRIRPVLNA